MSHVKYKKKKKKTSLLLLRKLIPLPPRRIMPKERNRVNKVIEKMNVGKFIPPT